MTPDQRVRRALIDSVPRDRLIAMIVAHGRHPRRPVRTHWPEYAAADAKAARELGKAVRELIAHPFMRVVPMTVAEWSAVEKRSRKTMGSEGGARRSFQAAAWRYRDVDDWQEIGL